MTYSSTIARAELLPRATPVKIARFTVDGSLVDFPLTEADLTRDAAWSTALLSELGLSAGHHILISSFSWHGVWFDGLRKGALELGAAYSNVEAWGWDATRFTSFLNRFEFEMVIGVGSESVAALAQGGQAAELLGRARRILARPDAVAPLAELGIDASVIGMAGPVLLVSDPSSEGLVFNDDEWLIESDDGELIVTTSGPRAARFDRQRTGVRGSVVQVAGRTVVRMEDVR
jgi:hypothetical protein